MSVSTRHFPPLVVFLVLGCASNSPPSRIALRAATAGDSTARAIRACAEAVAQSSGYQILAGRSLLAFTAVRLRPGSAPSTQQRDYLKVTVERAARGADPLLLHVRTSTFTEYESTPEQQWAYMLEQSGPSAEVQLVGPRTRRECLPSGEA